MGQGCFTQTGHLPIIQNPETAGLLTKPKDRRVSLSKRSTVEPMTSSLAIAHRPMSSGRRTNQSTHLCWENRAMFASRAPESPKVPHARYEDKGDPTHSLTKTAIRPVSTCRDYSRKYQDLFSGQIPRGNPVPLTCGFNTRVTRKDRQHQSRCVIPLNRR